jgi:hypothetical protein
MTTKEIFAKNREQHKGTFMDRAWRQASTESLEAIADPNLTARQKFWKGAYTYQGITTHLSNTMKDKQSKV